MDYVQVFGLFFVWFIPGTLLFTVFFCSLGETATENMKIRHILIMLFLFAGPFGLLLSLPLLLSFAMARIVTDRDK